ncbi:MAG: cupin domain-containing protein [Gammaproteobacteria bacterium]|nr:cupin domain-containing protein [Gammaproteobacteria bacterium]
MSIENHSRSKPRSVAISLTAAATVLATVLAVGVVTTRLSQAESKPPEKHRGLGVVSLGVVSEKSMQKQLGLEGHVLQLRKISIAPGGAIAKHGHGSRPGLVYTTEGTWIEGRPGGERAYPAGVDEALVEDAETVHWFYNRGSTPATALVCDIVPAS